MSTLGRPLLGVMKAVTVVTSAVTIEALLARARDAVSRGEWRQAYDLLVETDAQSPLSAPDLALLADMAYPAGHLDVTIAAWERADGRRGRVGGRLSAGGAGGRRG